MTYDIISVGDATLDTFVKIKDASIMCTLDKSSCLLCLSYADKIPVVRLDQKVAGNAANCAIGPARLGMKAALYSIIGSDETGKKIIRAIKREKVSTKFIHIDKGKDSNYTVVLNYKGERTQLIYRLPRRYVLPKLDKTEWIYYTAVGKNHLKLENSIVRFTKKNNTKLCFNPGTHQLRRGVQKLKSILALTYILFVNKEEAWQLVGRGDIKTLLQNLYKQGPKIVVITDASRGSYAYAGEKYYHMGVYPAKVVEMTGAGDAFATGFMTALHYKRNIKEALRWGTASATSVIGKIGPQTGLLTQSGMKTMIRKYSKIRAKEI